MLLNAYPEVQAILDYKALQLKAFEPGALIRYRGKFRRLADPWRRPQQALSTAFSPAATLTDKLRMARLRRHVCSGTLADLYERQERPTLVALRQSGFSERIIGAFFRPFLGGVFLEADLATSSRMFEFVFRMFSSGDAALPAAGMRTIPEQIASQLPDGVVALGTPVKAISGRQVELANGNQVKAKAVVIATEEPAAGKFLGRKADVVGRSVTCIYYAAQQPPIEEPILVLNGDGIGPINNLCVPSQVCTNHAPAGKALISVTVIGDPKLSDEHLAAGVQSQLIDWFGKEAEAWQTLKTYRIRYALPRQEPPALSPVEKPADVGDGIFICGDHRDIGSLNGAMASGRRAALAAIQYLSHK